MTRRKRTIRRILSDFAERMMTKVSDAVSNSWMKPGDPIPSDVPIYIVNNSDSNKKFKLSNGFSVMLTAPGTQGSVQSIDPALLRNPAVMAMWTDGRIKVTSDPTMSTKVMSSIAERDAIRSAELKDLRNSVVEDVDGGGNENEEDVSFKAKSIVDVQAVKPIMTSSDAVTVSGEADGALL